MHFLHFDLSPAAVAAWKDGTGETLLMIDHANYGHAAVIGAAARAYLARECL